jgi:general nucleoside transport system ATP-binding protein
MANVLELQGITKRFPGVLANDNIDIALREGKILALLGENGAGKSTLMNILYGLYKPDEGKIFVRGKEVEIHGPNDAIAQGIGMVHQHFMLVPVMTVTENVMLGVETTKNGIFLDKEKVAQRIHDISNEYGLEVDPHTYVKDLPVGIQQRVEIIKVLYRSADILILDEPTAVLTPQEVEGLFKIINTLIKAGKSIIFITHKLKEVLAVADDISVLRLGRMVGSIAPSKATPEKLASMMVGRDVSLVVQKPAAKPKEVVLKVEK